MVENGLEGYQQGYDAGVKAERARHAALVAAAQVTVGRFLDTPASLAGVHVAALNDLRDALRAALDGEPKDV